MKYIKTFEAFEEDVLTLKKPSEVKKYVSSKYSEIGKGTSRTVYDYGEDKVIKVAKNEVGKEQNLTEAKISMTDKYNDILAKVSDYDKDGKWIIQEKIQPIDDKEFKKLTKIDFMFFSAWFIWRIKKLDDFFKNKPFPNKVKSFVDEFKLDSVDIGSIKSWGKINRDGKEIAVLYDYGLSLESTRKFYGLNAETAKKFGLKYQYD